MGRAGGISCGESRPRDRVRPSVMLTRRLQVESMRHVHLHVISTDFVSPKLKNKK